MTEIVCFTRVVSDGGIGVRRRCGESRAGSGYAIVRPTCRRSCWTLARVPWKRHPKCTAQQLIARMGPEYPVGIVRAWAVVERCRESAARQSRAQARTGWPVDRWTGARIRISDIWKSHPEFTAHESSPVWETSTVWEPSARLVSSGSRQYCMIVGGSAPGTVRRGGELDGVFIIPRALVIEEPHTANVSIRRGAAWSELFCRRVSVSCVQDILGGILPLRARYLHEFPNAPAHNGSDSPPD
jgi:hypothetical protein